MSDSLSTQYKSTETSHLEHQVGWVGEGDVPWPGIYLVKLSSANQLDSALHC